MKNLRKILSLFGCCGPADYETIECDPTGPCQCNKILDEIQSRVVTLEKRIEKAERDVKTIPQYAEAVVQLGDRESVNRPFAVQPVSAPIECFYADTINELFNRSLTVTSKLHRNSEIVQHCLAYALATYRHVFSKEPILIPGVSPPVAKTIHCRCRCMPVVKILQKYVLNLLRKMDCNDEDLLMCLDHTKATYSPNSDAQTEGQEEQAV
ncbi:hypothetical protein TSAR_003351 [Trichomalopsis sarcophagae]|uniref:Uncharacterized protein n=1 Tax=Trichomalopsis sarcophagae TaxID=543379 RepID=A0A232FC89_9HYME|nr:hypothetical protein TSAR_003351 [Trichomalopsis sarcophagae]